MAHHFWVISGQYDHSFCLCACPPLVSYSLLLLRTIASKLSMSAASYITTMLSCINFVVLHEVFVSRSILLHDDFLKFLRNSRFSHNCTYPFLSVIFVIELVSLEFGVWTKIIYTF